MMVRAALYALLVAALAAGMWVLRHTGYEAGQAEMKAQWDKNLLDIAEATGRELERVRAVESGLRNTIAVNQRSYEDEKSKLAADYERTIGGLLQRPGRPSDAQGEANGNPGSAVGATGAQLYREDAAFLAGEAARADRVRLQLERCQRAYDAARDAATALIANATDKVAEPAK